MNRKGAERIIDDLYFRIYEIEETRIRLTDEEKRLRARILELEQVVDPIVPDAILFVEEKPIVPSIVQQRIDYLAWRNREKTTAELEEEEWDRLTKVTG